MALPITIPNTFANATASIPLANLDANFVTVANAINGIGNGSEALASVNITGGNAVFTTANATNSTITNLASGNAQITGGAISNVTGVANSTVEIIAGTGLTGGGNLTANVTIAIANTAVNPGTYGGGSNAAQVTVDQQGRLTGAANVDIPQGTVTNVATGTGLTGGPITSTGTVSVATNGITDALLRQSAGYAVVGRSASTTGNVADITAGSDHQVLRRSGTSIGFGAVALNQTNAITGTLPEANGGTGITSFGTGVATWLGTPSSANLAAAMTDETGSGLLVFGTTPTITGLREKSAAISASDIDLSAGNYFTKTISGATTFTVSNVATSGDVAAFVLVLTDGGAYTVTYFSGVTFAGGTAPTLTASGVDILAFFTINGGTTWRGLVLALDIKAP
jgi:hypothetical protein